MTARYTFYLAQSLRDAHEYKKAVHYYQQRADMGGWAEERYVALLNAARIMHNLGTFPHEEVEFTLRQAHHLNPARVEAAADLARLMHHAGRTEEALRLAQRLKNQVPPENSLFLEPAYYGAGMEKLIEALSQSLT
ncbi:MAG: tetratricopeptide repeat protein [Limnobacter sp.]|nr:tetratricopeptide repeat protein [Limnobacter sp.]